MPQRYLILICIMGLIAIGIWIYHTVASVPRDKCTVDNPYCGSLTREPE